jgi:7-carboxy-7-deazaguanine synthase
VGCVWCDTKYSWDAARGDAIEAPEIWARARALGDAPLLVVTGGEPLEHPALAPLLADALSRWARVEVETSGIAAPPLHDPRLGYNVSPKLPSATPRWRDTWAHIPAWLEEPRATFKIVVGDAPDLDDAERLIAEHRLPHDRVMLMPEGITPDALRARATDLAVACKRLGVRLGPRLHVWLWGARRGV